jgi:hypothetical protein
MTRTEKNVLWVVYKRSRVANHSRRNVVCVQSQWEGIRLVRVRAPAVQEEPRDESRQQDERLYCRFNDP